MSLSCAQCGLIGSVVDVACRRCGAPLTSESNQGQQLVPYNSQLPAPPPWQSSQPPAVQPPQAMQPWQQQQLGQFQQPQQPQQPQPQWPGQSFQQPPQQWPNPAGQQQQQQWPQPQQQQQQTYNQQPYAPQQYPGSQQPQWPGQPNQPVVIVNKNMPGMPYREIKNPGLAAMLSFFIPGLGQLYNGEIGKGVLMFFGTLFLLFFFVGIGVYVWSIIDAYHTAKKINSGTA